MPSTLASGTGSATVEDQEALRGIATKQDRTAIANLAAMAIWLPWTLSSLT